MPLLNKGKILLNLSRIFVNFCRYFVFCFFFKDAYFSFSFPIVPLMRYHSVRGAIDKFAEFSSH